MPYFAKAPLVIIRGENGADVYVYAGQPIPEGADKGTIKQLIEEGLVVKDVTETNESQTEAPSSLDRPAESGPGSSKDKWIAFAAQEGVEIDIESEKSDIIAAVSAAGK